MSQIREYLSYNIKIYEMAKKYTWDSVLQYDDEFRVLQHMYGYSWSHDHGHLHEIVLIPRWADPALPGRSPMPATSKSPTSSSSSNFVSHGLSGLEICRNFNRPKGCSKQPCRFSHVCNRRVGTQACGKAHPGHAHPSAIPSPH